MTDPFRTELEAALGAAYTIEHELTGGGMSRVFVAVETALGRRVVVKVLPPDFAAGVNSERFRREIQLAAQLQHPHIVPLLAAGEHTRLLYYTMPFIEGESLRDAVDRQGRHPVREVLRILRDVVEALAYAHDRGVIHRDIKPGNVLMQDNHALITDFGVAKALNAALPPTGATSTGMAIGTPAYMAPEQLAGDPGADHRVDLYAVGLLAYELLTGKSPFASKSPQATMAAQLTRDPDPLDRSYPEIPPQLALLVSACLRKEASERPNSARDLLASLEAMTTQADATVPLAVSRPKKKLRAAVLTAVGLAVVAAVATAGLSLVGSRGQGDPLVSMDSLGLSGDSTFVSALEAPRARDTVFVPQPGVVERTLSRDDSLAIAAAVARREREFRGTGRTALALDSVLSVVRLEMVDSLMRITEAALALAGRPPQPPREPPNRELFRGTRRPSPVTAQSGETISPDPGPATIIILPFRNGTGNRALDSLGPIITDSLARSLGRTPSVITLIESGRRPAPGTVGRPPRGARRALLEGTILMNPKDSTVRIMAVLRPMETAVGTNMPGWSSPRVFRSAPTSVEDPLGGLDLLLRRLTTAITLKPELDP